MSFLHSEALLKLLYVLERRLPVNDYAVDGVHVWPIIRIALSYGLINNDSVVDDRFCKDPKWRAIVDKIDADYAAVGDCSADRPYGDFDPATWQVPERTGEYLLDALFFTRSDEHFLSTPDGCYAPVLDPWYEACRASGTATKMEILGPLGLKRHPRRHLTHMLAPNAVANTVPADHPLGAALEEQIVALGREVAAYASRFGFGIPGIGQSAGKSLAQIWHYRNLFSQYLRLFPARSVWMNCFYHNIALALSWAARDCGAASIEVQHGVNGHYHMGYTHWSALPAGGYCTLPQTFLTWGESSANNIARWFPRDHRHHAVVIGGKPLVSFEKASADDSAALGRLRGGYGKAILVTLQTSERTAVSEQLLETIRCAPDDWLWLIRAHPMAEPQQATASRKDFVEARMAESGIRNYETTLTSTMPLDAVLSHCDHHITYLSSVALEAFRFDVPTTFIHPAAIANFHRAFILQRMAYYALEPQDIVATIRQGRAGIDWPRTRVQFVNSPALVQQVVARLKA